MTPNQLIHKLLHGPDACWHENLDASTIERVGGNVFRSYLRCTVCHRERDDEADNITNPDYIGDIHLPDLIRVAAIQKAVDVYGEIDLDEALSDAMGRFFGKEPYINRYFTVTAPVVMTAIAAMIEENEKENTKCI